ncbi:FAD/FMN-containing dehydrogenase [Nonomuraea jiangxiensis]|uniref:FAD/FMN-containing dehydrogenase n=2 Tax=Nonomuraea jiangxiensis TaxID=633440 RepID=A0A1G7ZSY4_9ACTN|nr:FAD/FMN-containing dehydrogenase [Nonomuraea jiangxiensis]
MDYAHPLRFGAHVVARTPQEAAERARLAEELGLDLVTVSGEETDTWTLLSWVAGRTGRIGLAPHLLDAAEWAPAVLGRAAAGLDLLAGGRLELGLGDGAGRWEASGVRPLPPEQAATALGEAIGIIRGVWGSDTRLPLRAEGEHYRIAGAERGPAPAHNIPVWTGGTRPDPAIAAGADGWLTTSGGLAADQAVIDEAAVRAGRDPREIRRLVTVAPRAAAPEWTGELVAMALEHGAGTFLVEDADEAALRRFAQEVVPAVRQAVAAARAARGVTEAAVPSSLVRAHRHPGIDYEAVPAHLTTIEPGDAGYARVRSTYMRGGSPGLVLRPGTPAEVADALAFARGQQVPLAVRSGGHGISGRSTNHGGIVIDVSRLNAIEVLDKETRRVRIGPGARWSDVAGALAPHGWALSSGDYGGVGVGGLATAGGVGWLVREHGLTLDRLRAVDLVLADGSLVRADDTRNAELFWAVRGAGGNFGIVTSFEFEVDEVGEVGFAQFVMDASDTAGFLRRWGAAIEAAPRDVSGQLIIGRPRPGQPVIAQVMLVVDADDAETVLDRLRPIAAVAPLLDHTIQILPYSAIMHVPPGGHDGQGDPVARSALADHLTADLAAAATRLIMSGETYFFQIRTVGGAVSDVPADATAYAGRSANFQLVAFGPSRARLDAIWDRMRPHFSGIYLNFETDLRPERLDDAFPGETLRRLRELKRRYDPANVFRDNFNITP